MYGTPRVAKPVSVPFRGFRGLQAVDMREGPVDMREVSVPFRGFRGLQGQEKGEKE